MIATDTKTRSEEKAKELAESDVFKQFEDATPMSLTDAIRVGSSNTEQAVGWGDGDTMCALSAAQSTMRAFV